MTTTATNRATTRLRRDGDGRVLCVTHYTSGAPRYHTEGCQACAEARAKGIIRPDVTTVTKSERCRSGYGRGFVDWSKRRPSPARGVVP